MLPKGNEWGGEAGRSASEDRALALGFSQRQDDGDAKPNANALPLR